MAPDALAQVLRPLQQMFPAEHYPQLLVGLGPDDDAAVYRISEELALIATLDFFTPIVDDPYQYGAIAATNALSDIYAMGGRFALALNICCLSECLPTDVISEVLRGGADKVLEAGGVLVGGHSVDDKEPKYGLAAIGFAHPDRVFTTTNARPGDVLVLTKPLGVGIVTTAAKADQAKPEHVDASIASMLRLNRAAAELLQGVNVRACTDVTGFALLGHGSEFAERSGVRFRFHASRIPLRTRCAGVCRLVAVPRRDGAQQVGICEARRGGLERCRGNRTASLHAGDVRRAAGGGAGRASG